MKQQHARVITTAFAAGGLVALGTAGAMAEPGGGNDNSAEKVTICHATGTPDDAGNGYIVNAPSKMGVINGHASWKNGEVPPVGPNDGHRADIIPPFTYMDGNEEVEFPGQNWDEEGQAIYENDCEVPTDEPSEPTDEPSEPTDEPSEPTDEPSEPTDEPSEPTDEPSEPTDEPSEPTDEPSEPTEEPTEPTDEPSEPSEPTDDDEVVVPPADDDDTTPPAAGDAGQPEVPTVVQTDGTVVHDHSMLAALGVAMLFAGGATAVAVGAGVSGRRH